ncbi:hypothetical protein HYFRA_00011735 [Hymenoscyphus fraxineus]|uniref:Uncharacterized protein n=1 Tax=Hymenoscyphus fraxineus TaxID=746836 RepID=A0A9N9L6T5_9HELO|nr:hypothetical protein HYFRA_00011735 [Hymenoscyphus fraxineus]
MTSRNKFIVYDREGYYYLQNNGQASHTYLRPPEGSTSRRRYERNEGHRAQEYAAEASTRTHHFLSDNDDLEMVLNLSIANTILLLIAKITSPRKVAIEVEVTFMRRRISL